MYLIAGLGNPGVEYEKTRHNMGFQVIDKLAKDKQVELKRKKFDGLYGYNNFIFWIFFHHKSIFP